MTRVLDRALELTPIGVVHSPWKEKRSAPRQPAEARGVGGTIELLRAARFEHALSDLASWSHIWVLFWFHLNRTWRPKVLPPRSQIKRGVFATRSPYRPNPLGLSVLALDRVERCTLHVRDLDILDGTPVFDIKPYVAYTDSVAAASGGWLGAAPEPVDPGPRYRIEYTAEALRQLEWLARHGPIDLRALAEPVLQAGATPHAYRRIRRRGDHFQLGLKDFRLLFGVAGDLVTVHAVTTGYRNSVLADPNAVATERTPLSVHRAFAKRFGVPRPG